MRRSRVIRKVVKVTVPTETIKSRVEKRSTKKTIHVAKKVSKPVRMERKPTAQDLHRNFGEYGKVDPLWKGETVYLIGGGPSLAKFEWNRLKNKKTIAINKAIQFYPNADALYWTDGRVYTWFREDIDSFKGLKYTIRANGKEDITSLKRGKKFGIEWAKDTIAHGNNSGCAAINLAIHLGAKRIILLGYDMGNNGTVSHFHDGYPVNATGANIYKNQFMPAFDAIAEEIKGKGIQIFNACPTSKLNSFKKITIEEGLAFR